MQAAVDKTLFRSTLVLIIFHLFGLIGMLTPWKDQFLMVTPVNILISAFLLFVNHKGFNPSLYLFCIVTFLFGYFIEVVGVKTGNIFGEYSYGHTLGYRLLNVPLVIGINWMILVYSVGVICNRLKIHMFLKSMLGAAMLVVLDFFIEPVAIRFDFWSWEQTSVPFQNYIAWFIASMALLIFFYSLHFDKTNKLAKALYIVQLMFFILLNIF